MFLQPCWSKVLEPSTQDVKFRLQHKILLSRAREFRLGKVGDPYCPLEGIRVQERVLWSLVRVQGYWRVARGTGGPVVGDWEHDLTACVKTIGPWAW